MGRLAKSLRDLLDRYEKMDGRAKIIWLSQIQKYLDTQGLTILEQEISSDVRTIHECNILLGAGARGLVYDVVNARRIGLMAGLPLQPRSFDSLRTNSNPI